MESLVAFCSPYFFLVLLSARPSLSASYLIVFFQSPKGVGVRQPLEAGRDPLLTQFHIIKLGQGLEFIVDKFVTKKKQIQPRPSSIRNYFTTFGYSNYIECLCSNFFLYKMILPPGMHLHHFQTPPQQAYAYWGIKMMEERKNFVQKEV